MHEFNFSAASSTTVPALTATDPDKMASADLNLTKQRPMMGGPMRWCVVWGSALGCCHAL